MSGHSKWANIQHRKGRQDAKRGKVFTKAAKEIIIAAKSGGDPAGNPRLRAAIAAAKAVNLPKDKIEAAIRKGTGEDAGGDFTEAFYEGYGPGGIAIMVEVATDNKNRTVADVRHLLPARRPDGRNGSVAWMFERKGVIEVDRNAYSEDAIMEAALDAGADDVLDEGETWTIQTASAISRPCAMLWKQPMLPCSRLNWPWCPQILSLWTRKPARNCCALWMPSMTMTTCRMYTPMRISPMIWR